MPLTVSSLDVENGLVRGGGQAFSVWFCVMGRSGPRWARGRAPLFGIYIYFAADPRYLEEVVAQPVVAAVLISLGCRWRAFRDAGRFSAALSLWPGSYPLLEVCRNHEERDSFRSAFGGSCLFLWLLECGDLMLGGERGDEEGEMGAGSRPRVP